MGMSTQGYEALIEIATEDHVLDRKIAMVCWGLVLVAKKLDAIYEELGRMDPT